jgi:hypothetical protein
VTWKKVSGATGYEVQYASNKKMKNAVTKTSTGTSMKLKKLKSGKTYYVKVRAYTTTSSGKVYGQYSKVKKIRIK